MSGLSDVLKQLKKDHGDKITITGDTVVDFERMPFGVFPLDLAMGGGIPIGKMSMVFGPESSGKTTMAMILIAEYQRTHDKSAFLVDAEWGFDPSWASRLGVDLEKLHIGKPETGEQAVEMIEGLTYADDVGLIVVDSIAGMVPQSEIDGDVNRMQVGGNSMLVGKMVRKTNAALMSQAKRDIHPTLFFINQLRKKIGVMFGNPETFPGGHALRHYCNIIFRTYGKDIMVPTVSKANPALKEVTLGMKKWKIPIVSKTAKYQFATIAHDGLPVGGSSAWNTIIKYSQDYGYIAKKGNKWMFGGEEYKTQKAIVELLTSDPDMLAQLKAQLIADAVDSENCIEPNE